MADLTTFQSFITNSMGINSTVLPANSQVITDAYNYAIEVVNLAIAQASSIMYDMAVYNLAGDYLINYAPDQVGQTFFVDARKTMHINDFVAGVVQSASDESTSNTLKVPEQFKGLTIADLQTLKTPWGRTYMGIAQKYGVLWGLS